MELSRRLQAVEEFVTEGSRLADIGTDHAYVPIDLLLKGRIPSAIAMDVKEGPLRQARAHVSLYQLEDRISLRLSDGLHALEKGEADTVLIAGMGGALTIRILEEGKEILEEGEGKDGKAAPAPELVLEPQSELKKVRRYLEENGWKITDETMVLEDGKFYPVLKAVRGRMRLTELEALYGPLLLSQKHEVLKKYLDRERQILLRAAEGLKNADSCRATSRREELSEKLGKNREAAAVCGACGSEEEDRYD